MITKSKLKIYDKYHGDGDMWQRIGTSDEKTTIDYNDWKLIENMIQDAILITNVKVSRSFTVKFEDELRENCDDESTKHLLIDIAKKVNIV
jgi:hypothetical protein